VIRVGKLGCADTNIPRSSASKSLLASSIRQPLITNDKMSGNSQCANQHERDLELLDSVIGSTAACANISKKLVTLKNTTAGCLSGPLSLLINNFSCMSTSYGRAKYYCQHRNPVWSHNVSFSIEFTQDHCQGITTALSTILDQYGILGRGETKRSINSLVSCLPKSTNKEQPPNIY
jgi:hypothetical protein